MTLRTDVLAPGLELELGGRERPGIQHFLQLA